MPNNSKNLQQSIIEVLGLESLPPERKIVLLDQMSSLVQKRVALEIMESLSEKDKAAFANATVNTDEPAVQEILKRNKINILAITESQVAKLKAEMQDKIKGL